MINSIYLSFNLIMFSAKYTIAYLQLHVPKKILTHKWRIKFAYFYIEIFKNILPNT